MDSNISVYASPKEGRGLFSRMRQRAADLSGRCFGRRARSYDMTGSNNAVASPDRLQHHDAIVTRSTRPVTVYRKPVQMDKKPMDPVVEDFTPAPDSQPLSDNGFPAPHAPAHSMLRQWSTVDKIDGSRSPGASDQTTQKPVLTRMFSLHTQDVVGTGVTTQEQGVCLVRDTRDNTLYAGKRLADTQAGQNELTMLQKLNHPNIANLLATYLDPQQQRYVVMENGGQNLKVLLKEFQKTNPDRGLSKEQISLILPQLLNALGYLEQMKIIHGDIKPDNLLLNEKRLKVCDFGLSRAEGEYPPSLEVASEEGGKRKTAMIVPLAYMPPEIVEDPTAKKVDIWSAGCALAELVTGGRLFDFQKADVQRLAKKEPELLNCIQKRIAWAAEEIDSHLGGEFSHLFTDMMQINPEKRITASKALAFPCITSLIEAQDAELSMIERPQDIPFEPVHSLHLYINWPVIGDSSDSDSVTSTCGCHPDDGQYLRRSLDPLIEVDTPKTRQVDKAPTHFTFEEVDSERLSTRGNTVGAHNPLYGQIP